MQRLRAHLKLKNFELQNRIGVGGDGEVWRVRCNKGKEYALKARPINKNTHLFQKEFERLRNMRLPHIIHVYETGIDKGYVYYTMKLVNGMHYNEFIQQGSSEQEKLDRCLNVTKQIAIALTAMHRAGLAHLDLKPDNIIVDEDHKATILDFGQACALGERQFQNNLIGTMAYISPEQRIGHSTDSRADVYALGISMYEAITGEKPKIEQVGTPPISLAILTPSVPLQFSALVDQMLSLDPMVRPKAEEIYRRLLKIEKKLPLAPAPWPSPPIFIGNAAPLLHHSFCLMAPTGYGCRRRIQEARRLWYQKGYLSVAGRCKKTKILNPFIEILDALFSPLSKEQRRQLAGSDIAILRKIAPKLPIPSSESSPKHFDPHVIANVLRRLFIRCTPIAIVIWDLHKADPLSYNVLQKLCVKIPSGMRVWITSRENSNLLPKELIPRWTKQQETTLWKSFVPRLLHSSLEKGDFRFDGATLKPLHSCVQAWRALAKWRGEELKRYSSPADYGSLGVLESPFPDVVGRLLCLKIDTLIQTEELELHHKKGDVRWYQIRDYGQSLLLEGQKEDTERHRLAAQAWQRYSTSHTRQDMVAYHKVCAKEDPSRHIIAALEYAVESNQFVNAKKWLNYLDCKKTKKSSFTVEYARAILSLNIEPGFIYEEQFVLLSQLCRTTEQRLQLQFLRFTNRTRIDKESPSIVSDGKKLIQQLKEKLPYLSLDLYRHLSLFLLEKSQVSDGLMLCQTAIQLGDALLQGLKEPRLSQIQQKKLLLQITLSGLLAYAAEHKEAVQACKDGIILSRRMNLPKYQTGFLINAAICQIELGEREKAKQNISFCSSLMERYESQPRTIAFCSLTQARLSIERGEFDRGFSKLDESISIGQNLNDIDLLCQAWSLTLDAAVSAGRSKEGKRAIRAYQMLKNHSAHRRDHWPAALARWYWMIGDLKRAAESLENAREGYSQGRILMERSRILLIGGKIQESFTECKKLKTFAQEKQFRELSLYAQILSAVTEKVSDGKIRPLLEQASQEEWTELYLGSLHLDLIRRKLRRQPLQKSLVLLNKRSAALNHMLFSELSKSENW